MSFLLLRHFDEIHSTVAGCLGLACLQLVQLLLQQNGLTNIFFDLGFELGVIPSAADQLFFLALFEV
jgi:hypothetical protein